MKYGMWISIFTFAIDKITMVSSQHTKSSLLGTLFSSVSCRVSENVHTPQLQILSHHEICSLCMGKLTATEKYNKVFLKLEI